MLNNFSVGLLCIAIAIFTCNWIAIAQSALSTLRKQQGWGTASHVRMRVVLFRY